MKEKIFKIFSLIWIFDKCMVIYKKKIIIINHRCAQISFALKAHEYIYSLQPFQKKATMPNFKEKFICKWERQREWGRDRLIKELQKNWEHKEIEDKWKKRKERKVENEERKKNTAKVKVGSSRDT